jgi:ribonuclease D
VPHEFIRTQSELADFCREAAAATSIGFDTEFISEHTYWPRLCLVQVAALDRLAVIDPLAIDDLSPFWELLAEAERETIVHAGREELGFCRRAVGRTPANLFDIQIAAGLTGMEYPAGYSTLIAKVLGAKLAKGETRTDWSRRPLSARQIEYALDDVRYLHAMRDRITESLERLGRAHWLREEMDAWEESVRDASGPERWRRMPGTSRLDRRSLAVVRELWNWREAEAQRRDTPVRRVLRDDLIVELAKRRTSEPKQIRLIRGMDRGDLQRHIGKIAEATGQALCLADDALPASGRHWTGPQLTLVGQFLATALGSICQSAQVAVGLVGTVGDVRDLVAYRLGLPRGDETIPALATSWRAEVVGKKIESLLAGESSLRVTDPLSEAPIALEPNEQAEKPS